MINAFLISPRPRTGSRKACRVKSFFVTKYRHYTSWSPKENLDLVATLSSERSQLRVRNVAFYYLYFKWLPQGLTHLEYALPISRRQITIQMFAFNIVFCDSLQVPCWLEPCLFIHLLIKSSHRSYTNNKCQKAMEGLQCADWSLRVLLDNGIHIWHQSTANVPQGEKSPD